MAALRHVLCVLMACAAALAGIPANAHDARPVSVLIRELPGERFALRVRAPDSVAFDNQPGLIAPDTCEGVTIGNLADGNVAIEAVVHCPGGVQGAQFQLAYPIYNPSLSTLFRLEQLDASPLSELLPPEDLSWTVPQEPSRFEVAGDYFRLGVEHIFGGIDHLLFVTGLLIVAGTWRRVLIALTGFTLAHSVTLALSALDLVRLPGPPVEAVIALSILFLAVEIMRGREDSITLRHPALVASVFGLLHGFGFAGVLREIGIPQGEIVAALLAFNLGVEAGQVVFVALVLALFALLARIARAIPRMGEERARQGAVKLAAYAMGIVSVFWLFDRVGSFA